MYKLIEWKFFETKEIPMQDILAILNSTSQNYCAKKPKLQLEDYNLRVDSSDWETKTINWTKVKINKEWDITEFINWEYNWEQLFTWEAMMRETQKAGKRVPTDEEFYELLKTKEDIKNLVLLGRRNTDGITFYYLGSSAYLWSSSSSGSTAYYRYLGWNNAGVNRNLLDKSYGFSVRCIKD